MSRVLLLIPSATYRAPDFMAAAEHLGVEVVIGTDADLDVLRTGGSIALPFGDLDGAASRIVEAARERPLDAVLAVDDAGAVIAAEASRRLALPHNPVVAVQATRDKSLLRERLVEAGVPSPDFRVLPLEADPAIAAADAPYPCVLKPLALAGSRGVIRANDPEEFRAAFERIRALLALPDVAAECGNAANALLVEGFVSGREVAVEGLLADGRLHSLAIFDKPDPLDGPFFEETIYVTPSRLSDSEQRAVLTAAARAARALGLTDGPLHAELRINEDGVWPIDIAARSIGGLCARTLSFGTGVSLEELILRHAIGAPAASLDREDPATGVMMIPIPSRGVLHAVEGRDEAEAVPGIESVTITIPVGQEVIPLPEGSAYLGFIFARGDEPATVERTLREAHAQLRFEIGSAATRHVPSKPGARNVVAN